MGVAVTVVPCLFMAVLAAGRQEPIENFGQVAFESGFKLDGPDAGGTANVEDVGRANPDLRIGDDALDLGGDILHVPMSFGLQLDLALEYHWNLAMFRPRG
jgi:hypothetical protein